MLGYTAQAKVPNEGGATHPGVELVEHCGDDVRLQALEERPLERGLLREPEAAAREEGLAQHTEPRKGAAVRQHHHLDRLSPG